MSDNTKTQISNLALRHIGSYRVDDIETDNSAEAQIINDVWDFARRDALSHHEWRFATRVVQLAASATVPAGLYGYAYPLPSDYISLGAVSDVSSLDPASRDFDVIDVQNADGTSSLCIVTNAITCFCAYVYDHTTVGRWPPWFNTYMGVILSMHIAGPLKSTAEVDRITGLADKTLGRARTSDSMQQPNRREPEGLWVRSMRTRGTN